MSRDAKTRLEEARSRSEAVLGGRFKRSYPQTQWAIDFLTLHERYEAGRGLIDAQADLIETQVDTLKWMLDLLKEAGVVNEELEALHADLAGAVAGLTEVRL